MERGQGPALNKAIMSMIPTPSLPSDLAQGTKAPLTPLDARAALVQAIVHAAGKQPTMRAEAIALFDQAFRCQILPLLAELIDVSVAALPNPLEREAARAFLGAFEWAASAAETAAIASVSECVNGGWCGCARARVTK